MQVTNRGNSDESCEPTPNTTTTALDASPSPRFLDSYTRSKKTPGDLKQPCRPRPPTSDCLNKTYPLTNGICFQNLEEAVKSMNHAQWSAPVDDDSIPRTDAGQRKVVLQIVDAFMDMTVANDTPGSAYRKRLTPGQLEYYADWTIEACAWEILVSSRIPCHHIRSLTFSSAWFY